MKYELIQGSLNDILHVRDTVFHNRKVDPGYARLTSDCLCPYHSLENIYCAVEALLDHLINRSEIHIVVDCDVDGYTSAAILYSYIKNIYPEANLHYHIHTKKQHGLSYDIEIPDTAQLVIIPDAGTNDAEQCNILYKKGMEIIILDHHNIECLNDMAIVVNNQDGSYKNKDLSGVGVVYKFLQALDSELWSDGEADYYLDLVALGNIADVMDVRSCETKYLIDNGLASIQNPMFLELCKQVSYNISSPPTINDIQFYIAPLINATIRVGSQQEKDLMFRAFAGIDTEEIFWYKKRGAGKEEKESIFERVARQAVSNRAKQKRICDKEMESIEAFVDRYCSKDKVLFVNVTDQLDDVLTGYVAARTATRYNRPCLLLRARKSYTERDTEIVTEYGGSGRNIRNGAIENFSQFLKDTEEFSLVAGHDNAFGVCIKTENIPNAISKCNEKLKDWDFSKIYRCDFILDFADLSTGFVKDIYSIRRFWGEGIEEPIIAVENVPVSSADVAVIGKQSNTIKFEPDCCGVEFIQFGCRNDPIFNYLNDPFAVNKDFVINVVGKASINVYKGAATPQFTILDYEVVRG